MLLPPVWTAATRHSGSSAASSDGEEEAWPRGGSPRIPATTRLCTTGRASASSPPRACLHLYEQPPRILDRRSVVRPVAAFARKCSRLQDPPVDYNWFSWNLFFGVSGWHMASSVLILYNELVIL
ncbi:uncharacterized protein LOC124708336 [Lolium rigidum]|uniref:uncharacterized protein LOC124708336 n=1 Tax=Lolium rigidum TaxID=89674 RepID=UPI001F5C6E67|nr:uncharacterized protein LOC124708336 [Lolium rigidum]